MENDDSGAKSQEKVEVDYWQGYGLRLFLQLWCWLACPLLIGVFLGKWLDNKYQTRPWLFLLCLGLAFMATCSGILMETFKYIAMLEKEKREKNDRTDS